MRRRCATASTATSTTSWRPGIPSRAMQLEGKRTLITGAGSGIGRALAIEASRRGMTVALCGRRANALYETLTLMAPGKSHLRLQRRFRSGECRIARLRDYLWKHWRGLDVLVNNAGAPRRRSAGSHLRRGAGARLGNQRHCSRRSEPRDAAFAPPRHVLAHRQCRLDVRRHRLSAVCDLFGVEIRIARTFHRDAARAEALWRRRDLCRATGHEGPIRPRPSIGWSRRCGCGSTIRPSSRRKSGGRLATSWTTSTPEARSGCSCSSRNLRRSSSTGRSRRRWPTRASATTRQTLWGRAGAGGSSPGLPSRQEGPRIRRESQSQGQSRSEFPGRRRRAEQAVD